MDRYLDAEKAAVEIAHEVAVADMVGIALAEVCCNHRMACEARFNHREDVEIEIVGAVQEQATQLNNAPTTDGGTGRFLRHRPDNPQSILSSRGCG